MSQIEQRGESVDALKAFNNAIVTSRLYPPDAPQVANAIERGYKRVKLYLHENGALSFTFREGDLCLCKNVLEKEVLSLFPNLVVYRQLRLLGLETLLLIPEMDRFAFGQILSVFNAPANRIEQEGGGNEYVTSLGLTDYFPEKHEELSELDDVLEDQDEQHSVKLVKIRPDFLFFLYGRPTEPAVRVELQNQCRKNDVAVEILAAGIGYILQKIREKKVLGSSNAFPILFKRVEEVIAEEERGNIASGLGQLLAESLKVPALCVLVSQEYPDGFGKSFFNSLLSFLSQDSLAGIIVIFREQIARSIRLEGKTSQQVQFLGKSLRRLMKSEKGKQFLGSVKARAIIHEGERQRKRNRIEAGLKSLLHGNDAALDSEELIEYLPVVVEQMIEGKGEENGKKILKRMISVCSKKDISSMRPLCTSLVTVADKLVVGEYWGMLADFIFPLMEMVTNSSESDVVFQRAVALLQLLMQKSWQGGENRKGDEILNLFYQIRSGQIPRSSSIKATIGKIQDKGLKRSSLPGLLQAYLVQSDDRALGYRLILQGPVVARFLVETLVNTEEYSDRIKIIDLLSYSGNFLPPVIIERLPAHMPWYGKRNLIKLLGETGNSEDARIVLPYLKHEDLRVQSEAFLCIYKIGGSERKNLLLTALEESSEIMKIQIVTSLSNMCDSEVATNLGELLAKSSDFSEKNRQEFLLQLLKTLGNCRCQEALSTVQLFLETRGQRATKKIPQSVWHAAENAQEALENALHETRKKHAQANKLRKNAMKQVMKKSAGSSKSLINAGSPREEVIRKLLSEGEIKTATEKLLDLIESVSQEREFFRATTLRQWLVEIDPNAYGQIIRAAEIIDREKAAAIDENHLEKWRMLYDELTTEEFNAVYYSFEKIQFKNEEVIVRQGARQINLFFVNSGKVKLYYENEGHEILVNTLETGEIFGAMAFFEASVWTLSAASIGPTDLSVLKREHLKEWREDFPGLESKLYEFSRDFEATDVFRSKSANDRRQYDRYPISGRVPAVLIDSEGKSIGVSSTVELTDISRGGISYLQRISQKENARFLLGRKTQILLPQGLKDTDVQYVVGDILAVKPTYAVENDYSVHVRFNEPISKNLVLDVSVSVHR